jgi:SAM-dependent methyltransferase
MAPPTIQGSSTRHGPLWGARARDWAENEEQQLPTYEEALRREPVGLGDAVLDIGCGSGVFLRLAADRGARVSGIDASEALVALARDRVPEADVRVGDMEALPYDDATFDLVTGFNSFFFASDLVGALREARRVTKPEAAVLIQVWGNPERCDLTPMKHALAPFAPPPPPGPPPPPLWQPGVLERLADEAGLAPESAFDLRYAFEYPDEATLGRRLLAPGLVVEAIQRSGEEPVRTAIVESLARYRTDSGSYRLDNEWHYLIARRPG